MGRVAIARLTFCLLPCRCCRTSDPRSGAFLQPVSRAAILAVSTAEEGPSFAAQVSFLSCQFRPSLHRHATQHPSTCGWTSPLPCIMHPPSARHDAVPSHVTRRPHGPGCFQTAHAHAPHTGSHRHHPPPAPMTRRSVWRTRDRL